MKIDIDLLKLNLNYEKVWDCVSIEYVRVSCNVHDVNVTH